MDDLERAEMAIQDMSRVINELHGALKQAIDIIDEIWPELKGQPVEFVEWFNEEMSPIRAIANAYEIPDRSK